MARFVPVKIQTLELAALAFAAYRYHKDTVHKEDRYLDRETDSLVSVIPNKMLMREGKLTVTDKDREDARQAIDTLTQDRVMRVLKGIKIASFMHTLTDLVTQPECTMSDAGLMAFLPSMAGQTVQRQAREQEVAELAHTSDYLGRVGDKIELNLTVLASRWAQQFNCWSVNGKDEKGNLVSFFTSKEECTRSGRYSAKIKRTETSNYHNGAKVTTLNFVKGI